MSTLALLLTATAGLCLLFAACFWLARRIDNYGVVDVVWSYAFGALVLFYAAAGEGWAPRRILLAGLVLLWSLRLGTHLARRVAGHHPEEDSRYRQLREDWRANFAAKMFGFFQLQALSVVLLSIPFLLVARHAAPAFHPLELMAAALWLAALAGEALADHQLAAFRRDPAHRGRVCDEGLWRHSRHPNYFFEWLIWVAYALFALTAPWGWLGLLSPLVILHLLLRVTGIPQAEASSLASKGNAYRAYQRRTNAFFPGPRKKLSAEG